jgi:hypothetical protein
MFTDVDEHALVVLLDVFHVVLPAAATDRLERDASLSVEVSPGCGMALGQLEFTAMALEPRRLSFYDLARHAALRLPLVLERRHAKGQGALRATSGALQGVIRWSGAVGA